MEAVKKTLKAPANEWPGFPWTDQSDADPLPDTDGEQYLAGSCGFGEATPLCAAVQFLRERDKARFRSDLRRLDVTE